MLLTPRAPIVNTVQEAVEELKKNPMYLKKPLIVDWVQSRAVIADPPYVATEFLKHIGLKAEDEHARSKAE
ncbi:hypothetical protein BGX31_010061 [Mortierella sp. GBA43]|nr:hypothetical protein BGX31_010061 [Mortierella sp. GBA43]